MTFENRRRSFGAPSASRPALRGPKGDKGNPGAVGPPGADGVLSRGVYHVDDFGAVARPFHDPLVTLTDAERSANVVAINACLEAARIHYADGTDFGGTVYIGPGVYHTNDAVGYDLNEDVNLGVTLQGLGPFPTMIFCNSTTREAFKLYTTSGNIRMFYMKDLAIYGGRTGLSLVRACYNRFDRVFFWGSFQFALQDYLGSGNVFNECYTTDTRQTLASGGGGAAMFVSSADIMTNCTFGEGSGPVFVIGGGLQINGGYGYGMFYDDGPVNYTDYWTTPGAPVNVSLNYYLGEPAAFFGTACDLLFSNFRFSTAKQFLCLFDGRDIAFNGCQIIGGDATVGAPTLFEGFINCKDSFGATALSISGGQFTWHTGTNGYFIREPSAVLHDAVIQTQLIKEGTAVITALSSSAPALLNPGGQNNLVTTRTFVRP